MLLGVNIDHVAAIREARGSTYPDVVQAAQVAAEAGADTITVHLREDRRHIQEADLVALKRDIKVPMNLEIAPTPSMLQIALNLAPQSVCLVPEKREERTTEGGLDVCAYLDFIRQAVLTLGEAGIQLSLFVEPHAKVVSAAYDSGAPIIELHTGRYAVASSAKEQTSCLKALIAAAKYADQLGLTVNAGHGLTIDNVENIARIARIHELNIGHSIVARAVFTGLSNAVQEMKKRMVTVQSWPKLTEV